MGTGLGATSWSLDLGIFAFLLELDLWTQHWSTRQSLLLFASWVEYWSSLREEWWDPSIRCIAIMVSWDSDCAYWDGSRGCRALLGSDFYCDRLCIRFHTYSSLSLIFSFFQGRLLGRVKTLLFMFCGIKRELAQVNSLPAFSNMSFPVIISRVRHHRSKAHWGMYTTVL